MDVRSSRSTLSEQELIGDEVEQFQEENSMQEMNAMEDWLRPEKRKDVNSDDEWTTIKSKQKKLKPEVEKIEMYLTGSEPLPKQFSLAKIFCEMDITDVDRVKYVNPYKVRIDVQNPLSAERIEKSSKIADKGWRVQRAMEKNLSYGVIRDIDLEISDKEIFDTISCPKPAELVSIFRLNRRSSSGDGWVPSESVRLCFKGAFIPAYVSIGGLRIRVDRYVFPVSQCGLCWKLGHPTKRCPTNKEICPKCGGKHNNCETTTFSCVNCKGGHMAMYKGCPAFLKEKRLREIMAEFNCTYRKALTMYVAPSSPVQVPKKFSFTATPAPPLMEYISSVPPKTLQSNAPTFASVLQTKAEIHIEENAKQTPRSVSKKQRRRRREPDVSVLDSAAEAEIEEMPGKNAPLEQKERRNVNFVELLNKLKDLFF
ncbi:uncharacterized protein LOC134201268 [Bombyx mori]|uniref:uncharacterized protein LOC134201268 n=1 Tax=Bombyx mori TaxID=7091 RepID=UPI002ED00B12